MRNRLSYALSFLAVLSLFIGPFVMLFFEPEREEAIAGGVLIGAAAGSVLGIIAMILNGRKKKLVYILSAIPMVPLLLFLLLAIPFYMYR